MEPLPTSALVLLSGGMDSTTLAYTIRHDNPEMDLHALAFDYGQRHGPRELPCAAQTAGRLRARFDVVNIRALTSFLSGSALTDPENVAVPEGHYSDETMRATVVPNRNAIMLNIAVGVAVARGLDRIATAVHAGDHPIYPDCRPEFIGRLNDLIEVATEGFSKPGLRVLAPFVMQPKDFIAKLGDRLGVPWRETWSCYMGGETHCGRCGTCVERAEAFALAGVDDPTVYLDPDFWRTAAAAG